MSVHNRRRAILEGKRRLKLRGFTLIEILVVIIIVGIVSAIALLSFGVLGDDRNLQREARRLSSLIQLANDEATLQGRDYGLEILRAGYRFVEFDPLLTQWNEVVGDEILRPRPLETDMEFELFIEDRSILLEEEASKTERDEDETKRDLTEEYIPHVLILSSGDMTPFELRIHRRQDRTSVLLTMSLAGELEVTSEDQDVF